MIEHTFHRNINKNKPSELFGWFEIRTERTCYCTPKRGNNPNACATNKAPVKTGRKHS